ncbi:MAG: ABC transporter ATP-binding protein [Clostridia bacterium]|nr:ABC transporter ATP-binding protein [Clostridia bacterium]
MIEVVNVTKTFDGFIALDEASLRVEKGSVYGLVGPNGAGKTTLMKILSGVFVPDSGSVTINSYPVYENTAVKKDIMYIGDDLFFFPSYTIADAARFYAGIYENWDNERFESLKSIFNISTNRRIRNLSKGMQKQVAFWLGISTKPSVMLLDEPVDGLDPVMRRSVWSLVMQDVTERATTVLISSHNLRELEDVCDHVGILHKGKTRIEKALDDMKGSIHKVQIAFEGAFPQALLSEIKVLHQSSFGSVYTLIVNGESERIIAAAKMHKPLVCDILPLTLEEVFIYELGGMGYEFESIIL